MFISGTQSKKCTVRRLNRPPEAGEGENGDMAITKSPDGTITWGGEKAPHTIAECPQGPTIESHGEILRDLKDSNKRVADALEVLARRGAQVDSLEKRADDNKNAIQIAFSQIRDIDKRTVVLEMDRSYHKGEEKAEEILRPSRDALLWTKLERLTILLQVSTPALVGVFFLFWMLDKYQTIGWLAKMFREMVGR